MEASLLGNPVVDTYRRRIPMLSRFWKDDSGRGPVEADVYTGIDNARAALDS